MDRDLVWIVNTLTAGQLFNYSTGNSMGWLRFCLDEKLKRQLSILVVHLLLPKDG